MDGKTWTADGTFFTHPDFDFEARGALGAASAGIGDVGLVLAALEPIEDGNCQSWFDSWTAIAETLEGQGREALHHGRMATASWALLAAAEYRAKALTMIDGLVDQSGLLPAFQAHRACWDGVIEASEGRFVRLDVPYEQTMLPGYLMRPDDSGLARPTIVVTNGSDGSISCQMEYGTSEALARGWNVFLYDGPGQQSMLFEQGMPFRHDWEAVLTPVIDVLVSRADVDAERLAGYGLSQGGYWLPRAIAFEHRLRAAVADPGVVDVSTSWVGRLPQALVELLNAGDRAAFDAAMAEAPPTDDANQRVFAFRSRPYGTQDLFDVLTEVRRYQVRDVADRIQTPLLITAPQDEQFWPGQSKQLQELVPGSEVIEFTRAQGANFHCQPAGRRLTNLAMLDWLEDKLDIERQP